MPNPGIQPGIMMYGPVTQYGPNLLSKAASSFEDGSIGAWINVFNLVPTNTTAQAFDGTHSLLGTASVGSTVYFGSPVPPGAGAIPVSPNIAYCATAYLLAGQVGRTALAQLRWYDSSNTLLVSSPAGPTINLSTTLWSLIYANGVAPSNAAFGHVVIALGATAINDTIYADLVSFNQGAYYPT